MKKIKKIFQGFSIVILALLISFYVMLPILNKIFGNILLDNMPNIYREMSQTKKNIDIEVASIISSDNVDLKEIKFGTKKKINKETNDAIREEMSKTPINYDRISQIAKEGDEKIKKMENVSTTEKISVEEKNNSLSTSNNNVIVEFWPGKIISTGITMTGSEEIEVIPISGRFEIKTSAKEWLMITGPRIFPKGGSIGPLSIRGFDEGQVRIIQTFK